MKIATIFAFISSTISFQSYGQIIVEIPSFTIENADIFIDPEILYDTSLGYFNGKLEKWLQLEKDQHYRDSVLIYLYYKNGVKSLVEQYYSNGYLAVYSPFNNKGRNGITKKYYKNGELRSYVNYVDGEVFGTFISFFESGQIASIECGPQSMASFEFYESNYLERAIIVNDKIKLKLADDFRFTEYRYWENGQLSSQEICNDGKKPYFEYYSNGKLALSGNIINAVWSKVGEWVYYYKNGNKEKLINYLDTDDINKVNILNGVSKFWNESGKLTKIERYLNGNLIEVINY